MRDLERTSSGENLAIPEVDDDGPVYPTVIKQAQDNMQKFEDCVLLTRMGGFYELYLEHAEEYGPLLNLKVAQKKTSAGPVAMVSDVPLRLRRVIC
jgi:DNA mismatch repair ATPase MutS